MLRPETLREYVRAHPFRPFRITMNSGKSYEVRHRDFIHIGKDFFNWYEVATTDDFPDRWETVSLMLIQSVEHIDQGVAATT